MAFMLYILFWIGCAIVLGRLLVFAVGIETLLKGIEEMNQEVRFTDKAQEIADKEHIEFAVAMYVVYLQNLIERIIEAAKANPSLRDFPVFNPVLEEYLEGLNSQKERK